MTGTRNSWKKRTILFLISQCITLFGSQIVQMAIVWYVTLRTDSGAWVAAFSVCSYLPQFFVSFAGGVLADRYHRKCLIIGADALIAAVTLAMLLLMPKITSEPVLLTSLLVMSILRSAGAGIQNPAVSAVLPQFVPEEYLMRYNGINASMQSGVQFAAPAASAAVLTVSTLRTTLTTMLQENTEQSMQGRVFGLMSSFYSGCYPVGMALFRPMADRLPLQWIMIFSGAALIVTAVFCREKSRS